MKISKISLMQSSIDFITNHIMKDRFFPKHMIRKYMASKGVLSLGVSWPYRISFI